ncbi:hypothetical protein Zmor_004518 [Zophobas morio]|uniref:Uncharacterized protein n=1 Tax=Zophobas morio TaxID=2755281 RepID=A0AA38HJ14_9CUCU|nr:hypothetical protein Zmor_004518 [Zophobas morio]
MEKKLETTKNFGQGGRQPPVKKNLFRVLRFSGHSKECSPGNKPGRKSGNQSIAKAKRLRREEEASCSEVNAQKRQCSQRKVSKNEGIKPNILERQKVLIMKANAKSFAFHDLTPSGTKMPENLKTTIGLGLKFCPPPPTLSVNDYEEGFDRMARGIYLALQFDNFSRHFCKSKI